MRKLSGIFSRMDKIFDDMGKLHDEMFKEMRHLTPEEDDNDTQEASPGETVEKTVDETETKPDGTVIKRKITTRRTITISKDTK